MKATKRRANRTQTKTMALDTARVIVTTRPVQRRKLAWKLMTQTGRWEYVTL